MGDYSNTPEQCAAIETRMEAQAVLMQATTELEKLDHPVAHKARALVWQARDILAERNRQDEEERARLLGRAA